MEETTVVPQSERRNLRYDFTAVETHENSMRLANKTKELAAIAEEAKSVASQWSAKKSGVQTEITKLSNFITDGFEYRDVQCSITYNNPSEGMKTLTRDDTGHSWTERMEAWEHNLFTAVTKDDLLVLEDGPLGNPDTTVRKQSKKSKKQDDILNDLENM